MDNSYIVFEVANTSYAVHSRTVQQIEMLEHITPLPNAPDFVDGVVFTRGQVIPALNLRTRFGFERVPNTNRTRLIVVNSGDRMVALIVDSAREFMTISEDAILPPAESLASISDQYLKGTVTIDDRIILVVNLEKVMGMSPAVEEISGKN
jgi:purine-binding chemotaxis protein CheW